MPGMNIDATFNKDDFKRKSYKAQMASKNKGLNQSLRNIQTGG